MQASFQRLAVGAVLVVLGSVSASSAEAAHGKYCYQGTCHNFHGESHVIHALSLMDEALLAEGRRDGVHTILSAQREVMTAFREFCQYRAKHELIQAKIALSRYIGRCDPVWLDDAASHLNAALVIEQQVHVHAEHVGHAHGGHGQAIAPVHGPVLTHRQPWTYGRHHSRSYVRFGGRNFSIGFGF